MDEKKIRPGAAFRDAPSHLSHFPSHAAQRPSVVCCITSNGTSQARIKHGQHIPVAKAHTIDSLSENHQHLPAFAPGVAGRFAGKRGTSCSIFLRHTRLLCPLTARPLWFFYSASLNSPRSLQSSTIIAFHLEKVNKRESPVVGLSIDTRCGPKKMIHFVTSCHVSFYEEPTHHATDLWRRARGARECPVDGSSRLNPPPPPVPNKTSPGCGLRKNTRLPPVCFPSAVI